MGTTLEEAIQHCIEVAQDNDIRCKRADDASGYSRSGNEALRTDTAKKCEQCAQDHRQLAVWLTDYGLLKMHITAFWNEVEEWHNRKNSNLGYAQYEVLKEMFEKYFKQD